MDARRRTARHVRGITPFLFADRPPILAAMVPAPAPGERRARVLRWSFAAAIVLGTFAGIVATNALAIVLALPRLMSTGLEPAPESSALRSLVAPDVAGPATVALLWLLGIATVVLAALVARGAHRVVVWRAYAAWASVGGVLAAYALVANWQLAREVGVLALIVGAFWSAAVAFGVARSRRWAEDVRATT